MKKSSNTELWVRLLQVFSFIGFLSILSRLTEIFVEVLGFLKDVVGFYRAATLPVIHLIQDIIEFLLNFKIPVFFADYILFGLMFSGILIRKLLWGVRKVPYVDLVDQSRNSQLYIKFVFISIVSFTAFILFILFSFLWPITLPGMITTYLSKKSSFTWKRVEGSYKRTVKWHGGRDEVKRIYDVLVENINNAINSSSRFIVNSTIAFLIIFAISQSLATLWAIF